MDAYMLAIEIKAKLEERGIVFDVMSDEDTHDLIYDIIKRHVSNY